MKKGFAALDDARFAAALLVIAIHTSPLMSVSADGDFFLTRVLARLAVPLFFMVSGYFLGRNGWRRLPHFAQKTALYYAVSIVLYLPLNLYQGGWDAAGVVRSLLFDGTLYHLWYFPAVLLGAFLASHLARMGLRCALPMAGVLYLFGLLGDSYYGLAVQLGLEPMFSALFHVFSYTRNSLFFAPLFLLLGAAGRRFSTRTAALGLTLCFAAMTAEGFALHRLGWQRHDSMYVFLPLCMLFLFSLLRGADAGQNPRLRRVSILVYILHPWWIVLVRGAAGVLHLDGLLVQNSLGHFAAVTAASVACAFLLDAWLPRGKLPNTRAWREIDCAALRHNAAVLQDGLGKDCRLMAVVKAEAYGHGAVLTARTLQQSGVRAFAVATLEEAVHLRKHGIRGLILVLGYTDPIHVRTLRRWRITQTVADEAHARALAAQGVPIHVHLAVDTGMHRLGLPAGEISAFLRVYDLPNLRIDGMFSHLGVSDSLTADDTSFTQAQLSAFFETIETIRRAGYDPGQTHIQASYGVWNLPPQPCAFARVGIALYGVGSDASPVQRTLDLWPVLALKARVVLVRPLAAGDTAGYGQAFRAERPTRLAVVSIGYADGVPRDAADRGVQVLVHGRRAPVVGRVCMDQLLVDVTDVPGVQAGDAVTLIGRDGGCEIRAEQLADWCGTITNELLSRLGARLGLRVHS